MAVATVDDVQDRFDRPLSEDERRLAEVLLGDVEAMIRARIRDLDARVAADSNYRALVVKIEAAAVLRVLRNPEGYRQETEDRKSTRLNSSHVKISYAVFCLKKKKKDKYGKGKQPRRPTYSRARGKHSGRYPPGTIRDPGMLRRTAQEFPAAKIEYDPGRGQT